MKHQNVLSKIRKENICSSFRRKVGIHGLRLATSLGFIALSSFFVRLTCRPLKVCRSSGKPRVWVLGKEGLTDDLLVTLDEEDWAFPIDFPRDIPKAIAKKYLPPGIDDNNYVMRSTAIDIAKNNYMEAWQEILRKLPSVSRPQAITSGNFGYYAERELARASEREKIPFIAMHKECLKSEGRFAFFKTVYQRRGKFEGAKILVYNDRERDLQISAQVARPDQVIICGMPRLDRLHRWRAFAKPRPERAKTLLALGFTPKTGLPRIPRKGEGGSQARYEYLDPAHEQLGWYEFFLNYHEILIKVARDNPSWNVQLKLKARHRDAEPSIRLIEKLKAPSNLKVFVGGDPINLIMNSDVICGFNSTAVLEGLAAGIPVITPEFDEVVDPRMRDFAASFGTSTHRPNDPASMYSTISDLMLQQPEPLKTLPNDVKEMLDLWVGNSDGRAGERVRRAFEAAIKTYQSI